MRNQDATGTSAAENLKAPFWTLQMSMNRWEFQYAVKYKQAFGLFSLKLFLSKCKHA